MSKRKRVIGTTLESIKAEEAKLNRVLPSTFTNWLLQNNGLGIEDVSIFPVKDPRDVRKTWESLLVKLSSAPPHSMSLLRSCRKASLRMTSDNQNKISLSVRTANT